MREYIFNAYYLYIFKEKWKSEYPELQFTDETSKKAEIKKPVSLIIYIKSFIAGCKFLPKLIMVCFIVMAFSVIAMLVGSYIEKPTWSLIALATYALMMLILLFYSNHFNKTKSLMLLRNHINKSIVPFEALLKQLDLFSENKICWVLEAAKKDEIKENIRSIASLIIPILTSYLTNLLSGKAEISSITLIIIVLFTLMVFIWAFIMRTGARATAKKYYIEDLGYVLAGIKDKHTNSVRTDVKMEAECPLFNH